LPKAYRNANELKLRWADAPAGRNWGWAGNLVPEWEVSMTRAPLSVRPGLGSTHADGLAGWKHEVVQQWQVEFGGQAPQLAYRRDYRGVRMISLMGIAARQDEARRANRLAVREDISGLVTQLRFALAAPPHRSNQIQRAVHIENAQLAVTIAVDSLNISASSLAISQFLASARQLRPY